MYAKYGLLGDVEDVFDKIPLQNTMSWSVLIAAYAEHIHAQEALNCFDKMKFEEISPNQVTFVSVLKSRGSFEIMCFYV